MNRLYERCHTALLRAYPASMRSRFETGMRYAFSQDLDRARARGTAAVLRFCVTTIFTTLWFAIGARASHAHGNATNSGDPGMRRFITIDWRDAVRSLRATPLVTTVAVLSLALGIGANTALFSILNSLTLKSLPVRDPQQLALLKGGWTNPVWEQIRARDRDLAAGAFAWSSEEFDLSSGGQRDVIDGMWASGRMFDVLGVRAILGRTLSESDDVRGGGKDGPVAVISYGFWQRRYGGEASALGKTITIQRVPITIVGITGPDFFGPIVGRTFDIAIPIGVEPLMRGAESWLDRRSTWWLDIMIRLRPGQTPLQASEALRGWQPSIRQATMPDFRPQDQASYLQDPLTFESAASGRSWLRTRYERPLKTILIVVGLVLLIACANIANLLLARAVARRHELSVRLALGASRFRLARQLFAESVLLSSLGAVCGLLFARWGSRLLVRQLATPDNAVYLDLSLDWRVLGFTIAVAGVTAILFGLAPAFGISGVAPHEAIKEQSRGVVSDRRLGLRNGLVVLQIALSLTLVVAAGLFARTFLSLNGRSGGFDRDRVLIVNVDLQHSAAGPKERLDLYERLAESAAAVPGAAHAAVSFTSPLAGSGWNTDVVVPNNSTLEGRKRWTWVNAVSPGWFATYGVGLVNGRDFDRRDRPGAPLVAVVNRTFAQRFLGEGDPIGREFSTQEPRTTIRYVVVGLVEDAVYRSLRSEMTPTMYIPFAQWDQPSPIVSIGVRAERGAPTNLVRDVADALGRTDPKAVFSFRSLSDQVAGTLAQERLVANLSTFFGALALLLAALGLYGVTSYGINRRRAEIGIRMALGAKGSDVVRLVLGRVALLVAMGIAAGAAMSLWASRFVEALLYGLEPRDPSTFIAAALVLAAVGLLAGGLPAWRATRIDPSTVLREG